MWRWRSGRSRRSGRSGWSDRSGFRDVLDFFWLCFLFGQVCLLLLGWQRVEVGACGIFDITSEHRNSILEGIGFGDLEGDNHQDDEQEQMDCYRRDG